MLNKISAFFQNLHSNEVLNNDEMTIEMACTVLLCEVMRADGRFDQSEQDKLQQIISVKFDLSFEQAKQLITQALEICEEATDFHQFTSTINNHFTINEKTHMVSLLWQLALADGELASIEEHIIRKVADLLHLRHAEYISAKSSVIGSSSK
jgi:uncharacterized tellurite resistance protein B-like protein